MDTESEQRSEQRSIAPTLSDVLGWFVNLARRTLLYWPIFVLAFMAGTVAFFAVPHFVPPVFESSSVLVYKEIIQADALLGANSGVTENKRARNTRLRDMLMARSTLEPIMQEFGLYQDIIRRQGLLDALEEMRQKAHCQIGEGDTITISFRGESPEQVVKVTRALSQSLTSQQRIYNTEQAKATQEFLEKQAQSISKELSQAEQRLAEFLSMHPEFASETAQATQMGTAIRASSKDQASGRTMGDPELAALLRHRDRLLRQLQNPQQPLPMPVAPGRPAEVPASIVEAQRAVERGLESLTNLKVQGFTDQHPDVVRARNQLAHAEQQLAAAKRANASQAPPAPVSAPSVPETGNNSDELKKELANVEGAIRARGSPNAQARDGDSATKESNGIVALETEWVSRNRDRETAREQNELIQKQQFKARFLAQMLQSGGGGQIVLVDEAYEPRRPVILGKKTTGAAGFAVIMFLGLVLAVVLAVLDDRIYSLPDLRRSGVGLITHAIPNAPKAARGKGATKGG